MQFWYGIAIVMGAVFGIAAFTGCSGPAAAPDVGNVTSADQARLECTPLVEWQGSPAYAESVTVEGELLDGELELFARCPTSERTISAECLYVDSQERFAGCAVQGSPNRAWCPFAGTERAVQVTVKCGR